MPYTENKLPDYPVLFDMWDKIAEEKRPVAVYGMGNGADKLFSRLAKYGKVPDAVFASDGFVRGHSFRGYKVLSFSEVKEKYGDFLILLSFASNRREVIEMLKAIDSEYDMLVPDMPVAGDEYFDKNFYNENYENIKKAYDSLKDEDSKRAFSSIINYKLFGKAEYLFGCYSDINEIYGLFPKTIKTAVDAGAYNGDTVREMIRFLPNIEKIYAIEPDKRNFKKLEKFISETDFRADVKPIFAAAYSQDSEGGFAGSGNRNSSISSTVSYKSREETVSLVKIDTVCELGADYIKYDVEGAEYDALVGSRKTIEKYAPTLLVSLYHRSEDIFSLVNFIKEEFSGYSLYLRRTLCLPAWEIALIAIKDNE